MSKIGMETPYLKNNCYVIYSFIVKNRLIFHLESFIILVKSKKVKVYGGGRKLARLSDLIEAFIKDMLEESDGTVELQRNELANYFNCVPSQINYVIGTRFTNEHGYFVESRRGGGGHIKIRKLYIDPTTNYLMHIVMNIGSSISQQSAEAFINNFLDYKAVSPRECKLMKAAVSDKVLGNIRIPERDIIRALILKNMMASLL